jgi:predicted DNA-binding transcriptional regulator AlpA
MTLQQRQAGTKRRALTKEIDMEEAPLMKMSDVASEAQLPIRTVYYLHQSGHGPKTVRLGRHLRVRRNDYDDWLESSRDE